MPIEPDLEPVTDSLTRADEQHLLSLARNRDADAFSQLARLYHATCMKVALSILRNRCDAEDEVQNAFCKAFVHLAQFRGDGNFSAWLNRIVENQCLMRLRHDRQVRFVYLDDSPESKIRLELVGQGRLPEEELGDSQVKELLQSEMTKIPPLLRNVMLLRYVHELPIEDIARRLALSIPAAKSRLMRAKLELRSRLTKHCGQKGYATLTHKVSNKRSATTYVK